MTAADGPIRWGIVATGRIAHTLAGELRLVEDAQIVAVSSRARERAVRFADEFEVERAYGSVDDLLADGDVDVVYVATPHAQHAEIVDRALDARKAVLCEKAFTTSLADAERLAQKARDLGVFCMEAMWMRFVPLIVKARRIVASGGIGEVRSIGADLGFRAEQGSDHRLWNPVLGGGALLDVGIYPVSFAQMLLGSPDTVAVHGSLSADGVDAEAGLLLGWDGGAHALIDTSLVAYLAGAASVVGTHGRLDVLPLLYRPPRLVHTGSAGEVKEYEQQPEGLGYMPMLREVQRCVREGRTESDEMPLADTVAVMRILDRALHGLGVSYPEPEPVDPGGSSAVPR
ncbi:MAG TPA: Gfo/Idh/MocA family oxidoreductase [Jiangellaceae bacterium]|nr:Gfo/Idh/MocA family oxidoreductase [Jiangellaceae bacterium]